MKHKRTPVEVARMDQFITEIATRIDDLLIQIRDLRIYYLSKLSNDFCETSNSMEMAEISLTRAGSTMAIDMEKFWESQHPDQSTKPS